MRSRIDAIKHRDGYGNVGWQPAVGNRKLWEYHNDIRPIGHTWCRSKWRWQYLIGAEYPLRPKIYADRDEALIVAQEYDRAKRDVDLSKFHRVD